MRRHFSFALVVTVTLVAEGSAQSLTIPQAVERARPGPLVISRISEMAAASFAAAIRDADLIVRASVQKSKTYLSDDEQTLYTDYDVVPVEVISEKQRREASTPRALPITLRVWGGETRIKSVDVRIYDENVPAPPTGRPLLLFLTFDEGIGKYEIYDHGTAAFELEAGKRLRPVTKAYGVYEPRLLGMDVADAVREIHQRGR